MREARLASYDLIRKIAAGGMAEIFLARQWGQGGFFRDVVIKRLFPHLAEHDRQLRMFQDEARLLSQLAHPNIPQVYDVGFAEGYWYIAMECVDGSTVADLWRAGAKAGQVMPMNVALAVVAQACEALHHAHERKDRAGKALRIVHRDVTPQNLMLTRDGVAKLMDFGVAQTSARKDTEAGAVRGTFAYMAPEQVRGRPLDKRADVFALGVVLYELTTGTRLYRGSDVQIMTQVVEHDAPAPSLRVPGYPRDLEEIVLAALSRDRGRRLPSAAHLTMYLEEFAMRNGLLISPRAIARYFATVAPAEPIKEEALGIVDRPPTIERPVEDEEARAIWTREDGADDELPDIDEESVMNDLRLLSVPHGTRETTELTPPLPIGIAAFESEDVHLEDELEEELDELLSDAPIGQRPIDSESLVLDGFIEDAAREGPVVLLDERARKDPTGRTAKAPGQNAGEYVQELERRLARDGKEPER